MKERAVSPVVGIMLLIPVTIALSGIFATLVSGMILPPPPPYVFLNAEAENWESMVQLTIAHRGGDAIPMEELKLMTEDENGTLEVVATWPNAFSIGDEGISMYIYGANPEGKELRVKVIHEPSRTILFDEIVVVASAKAAPIVSDTIVIFDEDSTHPNVLNLGSSGNYITCQIELLPAGLDVADIDVSTVKLIIGDNTVQAEPGPTRINKHNLMVKFSRPVVIDFINSIIDPGETDVELVVAGEVGGIPFEVKDTVRIKSD